MALPTPPPGFELESASPQTVRKTPTLPPGFQLETPQALVAKPVVLPSASGGVTLSPGDYEKYLRELQASPIDINKGQDILARPDTVGGRLTEAGAGFARTLANTGLGLLGTVAPETANNLAMATEEQYRHGDTRAANVGSLVGNVATSLPAAFIPGGAAILASSAAGQFRQQVQAKRQAGEQISAEQELGGAIGYGLAEYLGERWSLGGLKKISQAALKGMAKDFIFQYAKQAGIEASEEFLTQLAQDGINLVIGGSLGEEVKKEGMLNRALSAGGQGGLAGLIGGATSHYIGSGPRNEPINQALPPVQQQQAAVEVPDIVRRFQVKSREGANKGQPIQFNTDLEKAQYIVANPGFRGPVVEAAQQYVQASQAAAPAPTPVQPTAQPVAQTPTPVSTVQQQGLIPEAINAKLLQFFPQEKIDAMTPQQRADVLDSLNPQPVVQQAAKARAKIGENPSTPEQVKAAEAAVVSPAQATLPPELAKSKPRYGFGNKQYELQFANDIDRALYVVAQDKGSKRNDAFLNFVQSATGLDQKAAVAAGKALKAQIKEIARTAPADQTSLKVPAFQLQQPATKVAPAATPQAQANEAPATVAEIDHAMQTRINELVDEGVTDEADQLNDPMMEQLADERRKAKQRESKPTFTAESQPQKQETALDKLDQVIAELRKMTGSAAPTEATPRVRGKGIETLDEVIAQMGNVIKDGAFALDDESVNKAIGTAREKVQDFTPTTPATSEQALISAAFKNAVGGRIVWYDGPFRGFTLPSNPGTIFLNRSLTGVDLERILAHELMHTLAILRPGLFQQFADSLSPEEKAKYIDKYMEQWLARGETTTPVRLDEEAVTTPFGDLSQGQNLLGKLRREEPGVWAKMVKFFRGLAAKAGFSKSKQWVAAMKVWEDLLNAPLTPATIKSQGPEVSFAPEDEAAKTARPWKTTKVYARAVSDVIEKGDTVLDYGSGPYQNVKPAVEGKGAKYTAYDKHHKINTDALSKQYDVVMGSNVLNVQTKFKDDKAQYNKALDEMTSALKPDGKLVVNMPPAPRSDWMSPAQLQKDLQSRFENVERQGETFVAYGPKEGITASAEKEDRGVRPDLSLRTETKEGREAYKAEDVKREQRGEPTQKDDAETAKRADAIVARGDPAIHELVTKAEAGILFNDDETVAVKKFVDTELPKAIKGQNVNRIGLIGQLIAADRKAGTDAGRAFRQRRDPLTPAEQLRNTFAEAIGIPPVGEGGKPAGKPERVEHLKRIRKHLIDNKILGEMTPENLNDPVWVGQRLNELSALNPKANPIYEYFLASILSGPQTQERNAIGNIVNFAMNQVALRPVEMAINAFVKDPKAPQFGEWKYIFQGTGPRIQAAWTNAVQSYRAERAVFQGRLVEGHADLDKGPAIRGAKGRVIRTPLRLLTAVDQFMKTIVGMGEVGARAYRDGLAKGLKRGTPEMESYVQAQMADLESSAWKEAYAYAKYVAFQDDPGPMTRALTAVREVEIYGFKPLRYAVLGPFLRIAGKLESETWNYTPLGTARVAARTLSGKYKDNAPQAVQDMAKQAVAWTAFAALWSLVGDDDKEPWLTGTASKEAKNFAYRTAPPTSIRLPGYGWVSYKHLQPVSGAISTMIDAIEQIKSIKRGDDATEAAGKFVKQVKDRITDQTFLQSLGDFVDALDSEDKAATFLANFGASWVPNLLRQPAYQMDPKIRESKKLEDTSMLDLLKRRALPGVWDQLARVSPWGEEITKPGSAIERMVNPFTRYADKVHPADAVIAKYNRLHPDKPYYADVPKPTIKVGDEYRKMTEEEYYLFLRLGGRLANRSVSQLRRVRLGQADEQTMDAIEKLRNNAMKQAGDFVRAAAAYKQQGKEDKYRAILARMKDHIARLEKSNG